jgi:hypothetical protein
VRDRDGDTLAHAPIARQAEALKTLIRANPVVSTLLDELPRLGLPDWYLGAGALAQTVWNHLHGFSSTHGIDDYDIVYFDRGDLTEASESAIEATLLARASTRGVKVDVTNEARVHTWYEQNFGRPLAPYQSTEHAIATWPTTATSVGVRSDEGAFVVCAPFGLADLFAMVVRANTALIDREVYEAKVRRWEQLWPRLTILPWPSGPP